MLITLMGRVKFFVELILEKLLTSMIFPEKGTRLWLDGFLGMFLEKGVMQKLKKFYIQPPYSELPSKLLKKEDYEKFQMENKTYKK